MPYKSKPGARKYGDSPLNANKNGGYSPYKMKGHMLPGIKQSPGSSPFQQEKPTKKTTLGTGYPGKAQAEKCKNLCKKIAGMSDSDLKTEYIKRAKDAGCGCG